MNEEKNARIPGAPDSVDESRMAAVSGGEVPETGWDFPTINKEEDAQPEPNDGLRSTFGANPRAPEHLFEVRL